MRVTHYPCCDKIICHNCNYENVLAKFTGSGSFNMFRLRGNRMECMYACTRSGALYHSEHYGKGSPASLKLTEERAHLIAQDRRIWAEQAACAKVAFDDVYARMIFLLTDLCPSRSCR